MKLVRVEENLEYFVIPDRACVIIGSAYWKIQLFNKKDFRPIVCPSLGIAA